MAHAPYTVSAAAPDAAAATARGESRRAGAAASIAGSRNPRPTSQIAGRPATSGRRAVPAMGTRANCMKARARHWVRASCAIRASGRVNCCSHSRSAAARGRHRFTAAAAAPIHATASRSSIRPGNNDMRASRMISCPSWDCTSQASQHTGFAGVGVSTRSRVRLRGNRSWATASRRPAARWPASAKQRRDHQASSRCRRPAPAAGASQRPAASIAAASTRKTMTAGPATTPESEHRHHGATASATRPARARHWIPAGTPAAPPPATAAVRG